MTTIYVQFSDDSESEIVSLFGNPQDEKYWPHQGTVDISDARYKAYYEKMPEIARENWPVPNADN
ncbi:hypothetical protein ACLEDV_08020 [Lonsdalea quercina]|uniref:hypothetical protein n=1 Tax=Lonsdalea quercina TaxID=71657 RepID=UPI003975A214